MTGPRTRIERFAGAVLAILVQAGFLALLVISRPMISTPEKPAKELTLFLPRFVPAPAPPSARSAPFFAPAPVVPLPPTAHAPYAAAPLPQMRSLPVAPDLSGIGRALTNCNFDNYANLSPERRKLCPRPGEGLAIQEAPSLGPVRPRAKDEALWQEQWREDHFTYGLCPVGESQIACTLAQFHEERDRAAKARQDIDDAKAAALKPPPPTIPPGARAR